MKDWAIFDLTFGMAGTALNLSFDGVQRSRPILSLWEIMYLGWHG